MSEYTGAYGAGLSSFAGWCGACIPMDDSDADGICTVTVDIAPDTIEYKFTLDGWTAQEEFAGGESCTSTIDGFTNRSLRSRRMPPFRWSATTATARVAAGGVPA